jgi:hypothetical protein
VIKRTKDLLFWLDSYPTKAPQDNLILSALITFKVTFGKVYGSHG